MTEESVSDHDDDSKKVVMYGTRFCPYCAAARMLLTKKGVSYEDINVGSAAERDAMVALSGRRTVPQIFVGDRHIGGYDDMTALDRQGALNEILGIA